MYNIPIARRQASLLADRVAGKFVICRVRFCGYWIQEKTQDGAVLRQAGTAENRSDIATRCLNRQRLLYLMHDTGLVYIPSFENVGEEAFTRHTAKVGNVLSDVQNVSCNGP